MIYSFFFSVQVSSTTGAFPTLHQNDTFFWCVLKYIRKQGLHIHSNKNWYVLNIYYFVKQKLMKGNEMLESRTFCFFPPFPKKRRNGNGNGNVSFFFLGGGGGVGGVFHSFNCCRASFYKNAEERKNFWAHLFDKVDQDDLTNNTIGPLWTVTQHG